MHSSLQAHGSQAQYQDGEGNTKYGPDKKPKIKIKPLYLELEEGEKAKFKCEVLKGKPITSIYWTRGRNGQLPNHARTGDSGVLQFDSVEQEDEKDYFCHVTNDKGTTMAQARLNVRKAGKQAKKRQSKFLINKKVDKGQIDNGANPSYANLKVNNNVDKGEINNHASSETKQFNKGEINPFSSRHLDLFPTLAKTQKRDGANIYSENYVHTEKVAKKRPDPAKRVSPTRSDDANVSAMSDETYFRHLTGYRTPTVKSEKASTAPPPEEPAPRIPSEASSRHTEPPSHHSEPPKKAEEKKGINACSVRNRKLIEKAMVVLELTQDFRVKYQVRRESEMRRQAQRHAAMKAKGIY